MASRTTFSEMQSEPFNNVYVLNNCVKKYKSPAEVCFTHKGSSVRIPATWIPIDVSEYVPKEELLSNTDFRRAVNSDVLLLVPTADARRMLKTDDAAQEQERLIHLRNQFDGTDHRNMADMTEMTAEEQARLDRSKLAAGQLTSDFRGNATLFELMNKEDITESQRESALRNILPILNNEDLEYARLKAPTEKFADIINDFLTKR